MPNFIDRGRISGALSVMPRQSGIATVLILALLVCHGALGSVHQLSAHSEHGDFYETALHPETAESGASGATYYATPLLALGALGLALGLLASAGYRSLWVSLVRPRVLRLVERSLLRLPGPPSLARLQVFRI